MIVFVDVGAGGGEELHAASVKATMVKAKHPVNLPIEWKCAVGRLPLSRDRHTVSTGMVIDSRPAVPGGLASAS